MPRQIDRELTEAVLGGAFEASLWSTFLAKIKDACGADFATMIFRPPGRPLNEALHLFSGDLAPAQVRRIYDRYLGSLNLLSDFQMEEGVVYAFKDLYPPKRSEHQSFYDEVVTPSGVSDARMIRVEEASGVSAWLTVSRRGGGFRKADGMLIENIAPTLRGALRNYVALERERFTSALTGDAMRRLYFAWMTLDASGYILDYDTEVAQVFQRSEVMAKDQRGRLVVKPRQLGREILAAVKEISGDPSAKPRAFTLKWDPWLDMLLMPAVQNRLTTSPRAAVVAYVHGDSWQSSDRCEQLRQLFGLSGSEARLALAVSRGMTIAEAAAEFGLKTQTARKYTKAIYAKTGARGLPDLVRIVMRSSLSLAVER